MRKTNLVFIVVFLMAFNVLVAGIPTLMPQSFYGSINNLTAGQILEAKISGVTVGTFTLKTDNVFGGASANDDKLSVCGGGESVCTTGATITFSSTNGVITETTTFNPGGITRIDLTCTIPPTTSSSTTTSSGGGGGGTVATPQTSAEATASKVWDSVKKGQKNTFVIDKDQIPISKITFTTNKDIVNAGLTVTSYISKPGDAEAVPLSKSSVVYRYIEIVPTNIKEGDITEAEIEFEVPLSWFNENNADPNEVILLRFGNEWIELTTSFISKDSTNAYYKATTHGFSYFTIGLKPKAAEEKPAEETPEEEVPEEEIAPEIKEKKAPIGLIISIAIVVIGLIIYFWATKKKK